MASGTLNEGKKINSTITGSITPNQPLNGKVSNGGGSSDHNRLFNRDADNQHPISAITDLQTELNKKLDSETAVPLIEEAIKGKAKGLYYDAMKELATKSYWYLTSEIDPTTKLGTKASIISGPYDLGQGGGGGGGGVTKVTVTNKDPVTGDNLWPTSVAEEQPCTLKIYWQSKKDEEILTGNGTMYVSINGKQVLSKVVAPGYVSFEVGSYLVSGANTVQVKVLDAYSSSGILVDTVNAVAISLTSNFNYKLNYKDSINYTYIPTGDVDKTVYFYVDGTLHGKVVVRSSGEQQTYKITGLTHGSHTLRVYFTANISGTLVYSNELFYDLIFYVEGNSTPIIASEFRDLEQTQYIAFNIPYRVFIWNRNQFPVKLYVDGALEKELLVNTDEQYWEYKSSSTGKRILKIACETTTKTFEITINKGKDIEPVSEDSALALTAYGRSNSEPEADRKKWEDKKTGISCTLNNFNFSSDGWVKDASGNTVLRVTGDARVEIPYKPFAQDFVNIGKTIELEIATSTVRNYEAVIIKCFDDSRGFYITPQLAKIKSQQSELSTQYKEDDHVRLSFVVEKQNENRIIWMYINGVASGAVQYPADDSFRQLTPQNISIGSNDATIDIYTIRIYDNNLTRKQIVNNWIADTQDATLKNKRYEHNDVFNDRDQVVASKLPPDLPYIIWDIDPLPQYKGDKRKGNAYYFEPSDRSRDFTAKDGDYNVQGTSSAVYPVKNIRLNLKKASAWYDDDGNTIKEFPIKTGEIGVNYFTYKVDYASSEGANNIELTTLYNDASKNYGLLTPPQKQDARVRVGVTGYPIVAFHRNSTGTDSFCTKANFNNDKANEAVYGFATGDESWEITNNTADEAKFKVPVTAETFANAFEIRYPDEDGYSDLTKLGPMTTWVASTYREKATGEAFGKTISYTYKTVIRKEGGTYTEKEVTEEFTADTERYRLIKFKAELANWFNVDSTLFYYLFTHLYLLVDSRAKNAFPTYYASRTAGDGGDRWFWLPYDMDTAIGINNEGKLVFDYNLEDIDTIAGAAVFNGQDSVMWNNVRDAFEGELAQMYATLRTQTLISYETTEQRFEEHQNKWPENIFNEDAYIKYVKPLAAGDNYLAMLQGSKYEQRNWWLYNRFKYMDSKYTAGNAKADVIQFRAYVESGVDKPNITITPYADIYATVSFSNSELKVKQKRAARNVPIVIENPFSKEETETDQETYIYSASQLKDIGDISPFKPDTVKIGNAIKLQSLKVGDASSTYQNEHLKEITVGNNTLLKSLDARNCINLGTGEQGAIDVSKCINIEDVYLSGTQLKGITLPDGGVLKHLHLPSTLTALKIKNHPLLTDLLLEGTANIESLWLENIPSSSIRASEIVTQLKDGSAVRLIGIEETFNTVSAATSFFDKLDMMKGMDSTGAVVNKAQVTGKIHVDVEIPYATYKDLQNRYPEVTVTAKTVICTVSFYKYVRNTQGNEQLVEFISTTCAMGSKLSDEQIPVAPERSPSASTVYTFKNWYIENGAQKEIFDHRIHVIDTDLAVKPDYYEAVRTYTVIFDKHTDIESVKVIPERLENVPYLSIISKPRVEGAPEPLEVKDWHLKNSDVPWRFDDDPEPNTITGDTTLVAHWNDQEGPEITLTTLTCNKYRATCKDDIGVSGYAITHSEDYPEETQWNVVYPPQATFVVEKSITTPEDYYFWARDGFGSFSRHTKVKINGVGITKTLNEGVEAINILYRNPEGQYEIVDTNAVFKDSVIKVAAVLDAHYENAVVKINGAVVGPDEEYTVVADINIAVTCTPKTYVVSFNTKGKGEAPETQYVVYKHKVAKPAPQFYEGEIVDDNWYTDPSYVMGSKWDFDNDLVTQDLTLHAMWVKADPKPTKVSINVPENNFTISVNYAQAAISGVIVYWGDGTENVEDIIAGLNKRVTFSHTYNSAGNYEIKFLCQRSSYLLGYDENYRAVVPSGIITNIDFSWDVPYTNPYAFSGANALTAVTTTSFMSKISEGCFMDCSSIEYITMPENARTIGAAAFFNCINLIGSAGQDHLLKLPSQVTSIGNNAFRKCKSLVNVELPDVLSAIGEDAFCGCSSLINVNIPVSLSSLSAEAFCGCVSLASIDIPEHVTGLGVSCFAGCKNLAKVILRSAVLRSLSNKNGLFFNDCPLLKTAGPISDNADYDIKFAWNTQIPDFAFESGWGQSYLTSITLPAELNTIGYRAFYQCTALENVDNDENGLANLPAGLERIGMEAFALCTNLHKIDIPRAVSYLGEGAFRNCYSLTRVNIHPTSVLADSQPKTTQESWFYYCHLPTKPEEVFIHIPEVLSDATKVANAYGKYWNYYNDTLTIDYAADLQ